MTQNKYPEQMFDLREINLSLDDKPVLSYIVGTAQADAIHYALKIEAGDEVELARGETVFIGR